MTSVALALFLTLLQADTGRPPRPEMDVITYSSRPYAEVVEAVKKAAVEKGFSIVFELDLQQRIKAKGFEAPPTMVIGVCGAGYAAKALANDPRVAANLPCRIAIMDLGEKRQVSTQNTQLLASMYEGEEMATVGKSVDKILRAILEATE